MSIDPSTSPTADGNGPSTDGASAKKHPQITVRRPGLKFDDVPRHWFGGHALGSHSANALNLLFPDGERFFVRSVRNYLDRVTDEQLKKDVQKFIGQEAAHGAEHEHFFATLEAQGFAIRPMLKAYKFIAFKVLEPISPMVLRLSATAALEHFTATFATLALTQPILDGAHPTMQRLLRWHAGEEIEHRAVAFDVLQLVNPSMAMRAAGMGMAVATLFPFWTLFMLALLWQDRESLSWARLREEQKQAAAPTEARRSATRSAFWSYFKRDFHPLNEDITHLAQAYFAAHPVP